VGAAVAGLKQYRASSGKWQCGQCANQRAAHAELIVNSIWQTIWHPSGIDLVSDLAFGSVSGFVPDLGYYLIGARLPVGA
jgi:hypothetical protein